MENPVKDLLNLHFDKNGLDKADINELNNNSGVYYSLREDLGSGFYWYYICEGMFALAIMDICLKKDTIFEYGTPEFISVTYFETVSGEQLNPYRRLNANCVRGYVSGNEPRLAKYHKDVPIRAMELMLVPGYFDDYLKSKYVDKEIDIKAAFSWLDVCSDFPELLLLMRQVKAFKGADISAALFYESKVSETISLIMDKYQDPSSRRASKKMSAEDLAALDNVKSYISDHFAFDLTGENLAKIACMSQSKLRACFKSTYSCTITDYIQNRRIAQAEYMLLHTDIPISQIARAVGYGSASRFSTLFHSATGLLPREYRQLMGS